MSSANIGWMFYKEMFKKIEKNSYHRTLRQVANDILDTKKTDYAFIDGATYNNIKLKTIYPGLIIGSGYMHSMKDKKDNFDFGFYFDHTSGMPILPGSSVKGVLRSFFGQGKNERYKEEKENLIQLLLGDNSISVAEIDRAIFEGINPDSSQQRIYKRDIFHDAVVSHVEKRLFEDDSITPHSKDGLGEPTPNRMLKIAPTVTFKFNFTLHDLCDAEGNVLLGADAKEELFLRLLQWGGIGAKTNVGYGQFEEIEIEDFREQKKRNQAGSTKGFDGLLLKVGISQKVDNKMLQYIKKYNGIIENKEKLIEIVNSKMTEETNSHYRKIIKNIEGRCTPNP